jgi:hypothetical protein
LLNPNFNFEVLIWILGIGHQYANRTKIKLSRESELAWKATSL